VTDKVDKQLSQKPIPFGASTEEVATALDREVIPVLKQLRVNFNDSFGAVATVVTADTILDASYQYWLVDASTGDVTLTLPSASQWSMQIYIKRLDASANRVAVYAAGDDTIEDRVRIHLESQYATASLWADETIWYLLNNTGGGHGGFGSGFSTGFDL
jgi:hypothetical protein